MDTKEYVLLMLKSGVGSSSAAIMCLLDTGADDPTFKISDAAAAQLHLLQPSSAIDDCCGRPIDVKGDARVSIIFGSRTLDLPEPVQVAGLSQSVIPQSAFAPFGDCALIHKAGNRHAAAVRLAGVDFVKHSSGKFWYNPEIPASFFQGLSGAGFASTDAEDAFVESLDINNRRQINRVSRVAHEDAEFIRDTIGDSKNTVRLWGRNRERHTSRPLTPSRTAHFP